jgi:hypothetical protein
MALGIRITGGPLSSERLYTMTNERATELVDAFIYGQVDEMPPEMDTPAKVAQWKLDQIRIIFERHFMQHVQNGFDQMAAAEYQAIRDRNRDKAKLE